MSGHTPWAQIKREARYRRRRRARDRMRTERGVICEERIWRGPHEGATCPNFATGYQALNDIYVCGVHTRGYLRVEPLAVSAGHPR